MWCIYMWSLQCVSSYRNEWMNESHLNEWITSQCIAMHHITSHHITSHHITSHHIIAMCIVPGWSRAGKSCESCRVWWVMWVMSCQTRHDSHVVSDTTWLTWLIYIFALTDCNVTWFIPLCAVCHLIHMCVRCVIWCICVCGVSFDACLSVSDACLCVWGVCGVHCYAMASFSRIDKIIDFLFAEYRLFYRALLQKRTIVQSILLTVATPYLSRIATRDRGVCGMRCVCGMRMVSRGYVSRDTTHSCAWLCVTWHDSFICVNMCDATWLIHIRALTRSYLTWLIFMWHDAFLCNMTHFWVAWLSPIYIYIWHDSFLYDVTRSYMTWLIPMWHDSSCVPWLISMCAMICICLQIYICMHIFMCIHAYIHDIRVYVYMHRISTRTYTTRFQVHTMYAQRTHSDIMCRCVCV